MCVWMGPSDTAFPCLFSGPPDSMQIRCAANENLAMEVNWRKLKEETSISFWCSKHKGKYMREWAFHFARNADGTISPCTKGSCTSGPASKELVVGVKVDARSGRVGLVLVK